MKKQQINDDMIKPEDIMFSINEYDKDGDLTNEGVYLHFGETRVKASDSIEKFKTIVNCMQQIVDEIEANY